MQNTASPTRDPGSSRGPSSSFLTTSVVTFLLTAIIAATYGFGIYLLAQLVTDMRMDLGFGFEVVGAITAAGQIGFLTFALLGAWLAPRIGGPQVIVGSVLLCAACLLAIPSVNSIPVLIGLFAILGGCSASVYVPMVDIVSRTIAHRHRGKVLGLVSSGTSYGVFINGLMVPVFIANDDWRGVWIAVGTGTLLITAVAIIVFARLSLFRHARTPAKDAEQITPSTHGKAPLKTWAIVVLALTFLNGFSALPFQNYLSAYLREELAYDVAYAAMVWQAIGLIGMGAGFIVGWMSDKTGIRAAMIMCYGCIVAASVILITTPTGWLPFAAGVFFAIAFYPIFGLVPAYIAKTAKGHQATRIFGVANVSLGLGGMAGNFLAGELRVMTGTFIWIYTAIAVIASLSIILSFILPREGADDSTSDAESGSTAAPDIKLVQEQSRTPQTA